MLEQMLPVPANADLLSALNAADEQPSVFEIYCDLEFAFGRITTQLFFEISLEEAPGRLSDETDRWPESKRKLQALSAMFDKALLNPIDAVEQNYQEQLARFNSKINRERERKIRRLTTEVDEASARLRHQAKRLREVLVASPTCDYRIYFSDQVVPELRIFAARFARTAEESVDLQPLKRVLAG